MTIDRNKIHLSENGAVISVSSNTDAADISRYTQAELDDAVRASMVKGLTEALDAFDVVDNNCAKEDDWEKVIDLWKDHIQHVIEEIRNG